MPVKCVCPQRLIHSVTIEQPTYTQDAHNEQIATWGVYASRRKAICRAARANEVIQSEQVHGSVQWVIELSHDDVSLGITSAMRVTLHSYGDRVAYCDGPAMPVGINKRRVTVKVTEQTA